MKFKRIWAVTTLIAAMIQPISASAACTGPNPSTSNDTYKCICNKWELTARSNLFYGCDNKPYVNTEIFGWDTKNCISTDYYRTTYESVQKDLDADCSSYTAAESTCCMAVAHWYYKPNTTGAKDTWDWGTQCKETLCPKGSIKALTSTPFGTSPFPPTPTPKQ